MKNITKHILAIVVIALVFTIYTNANSQDYQKRSRTEQYRLPKLPNLLQFISDKYQYVSDAPMTAIKTDFFLTLRDGALMDASKFYPSISNPYLPDGYPVVIMVHGYGDRKETLENFAQAQADYGYVVYTYSVRGQGNSTGLSNLISRTEAQDLMEFVNYIKNDKPVTGSDTSKIMIMGGSQGGTLPYMAASMGMKVSGIISAVASPDFASSWIENGSVKMSLLWTIEYTPDTARYNATVDRMSDWIYSNAADKWDSLAYYMPINRNFSNIISNNKVPILLENSWQDMFFNALGNINGIPMMTAPARYYMGAVMGHGGDTSPTEDQWHMNFFNEWFFYWLYPQWYQGINLETRPKFHYAYTTFPETNGMWSFVHDSSSTFPPENMSNLRLYFNDKNLLKTTVNKDPKKTDELKNKVNKNYTMTQIVDEEFKGTNFTKNFKKDSTVYNSDVLPTSMKLLGTPTLKLDYTVNAEVAQFNFQIFEVNSAGIAKFITSINYTDRKNVKNSRKQVLIKGNSHGHIFQAGSKIRVIVTNLDQRWNYQFLQTNPYVLPVMTDYTAKYYLSSDTYIDLPLVGTSPLTRPAQLSGNENGTTDYQLSQNYPNPFNPSTKIAFSLPDGFTGNVTLKIYDIAGREIESLINTQMAGGLHDVVWNAGKYTSGIYFYKLQAGNYSEVKKMFLVK